MPKTIEVGKRYWVVMELFSVRPKWRPVGGVTTTKGSAISVYIAGGDRDYEEDVKNGFVRCVPVYMEAEK